MNRLTIIIVAYNEYEYVKFTLQSIRMFNDVESLAVILVDNGSEDELRGWASEQDDITYIYMDEGHMPYGKVINEVKDALELSGDILLLNPHYLLTPNCISKMQQTLYESNSAAVGIMSNGFFNAQYIQEINSYEDAIAWANESSAIRNKQVMGLAAGAILFSEAALDVVGYFDEELFDEDSVIRDYNLRLILGEWKLAICMTAMVWNICIEDKPIVNIIDENGLEEKWGMHYFNSMYSENLIKMISQKESDEFTVLEVGCDCGATLLEIKNRFPNASVYGCEINENAVRIAKHAADVIVNNIEEQNLPYEKNKFDYIIFGDVLEHLRDPLRAIYYCNDFLKNNGCIIASIPNLMHISVVQELLKGNFTYTEIGLLDKTHIHLFTFNEIVRMFQKGGYEIELVNTVVHSLNDGQERLINQLLELDKDASRFMYETFQYVVRARMKGGKM